MFILYVLPPVKCFTNISACQEVSSLLRSGYLILHTDISFHLLFQMCGCVHPITILGGRVQFPLKGGELPLDNSILFHSAYKMPSKQQCNIFGLMCNINSAHFILDTYKRQQKQIHYDHDTPSRNVKCKPDLPGEIRLSLTYLPSLITSNFVTYFVKKISISVTKDCLTCLPG